MSFSGNLYPHQVKGAEFLINKKKALLQHEQGLGKTVTTLAACEKLRELGKADTALIVGQAGYLWQWANAIETFTDSTYTVANAPNTRVNYAHKTDYSLVSYNIYRRDFRKLLVNYWPIFVCDEAQEFANNKSKTAKLVKQYNLEWDPSYRWALTGTAIRNKLENLYSIMYWVDRQFLPPWPKFEAKHIVRDERTKQIVSYKNLKPLNEYLKNRTHRCTHKDVIGSVPRIIGPVIHTIEPTYEYLEAQDQLLTTLDQLNEDITFTDYIHPKTKSEVSKAFSRCRETLISETKIEYLVKEVQKVLEENDENRVVVFSYYKYPIKVLGNLLHGRGIDSANFTGDESSIEKQNSISRFSSDCRVLLASNAGYKGLDLPFANYLYHLDIPLSFEILDQRNKRITRLSSIHKAVVINYLMTERSIEQYYFDIVLKQGELLKATFDEAKNEVKVRSETLRQYLNGYRRKKTNTVLSTEEGKSTPRPKTRRPRKEN